MLANFLGKENARAPLFGRAIHELHTYRLDKERASLFLRLGAKQLEIIVKDKEIGDAILNLDGIIGWLTKYGWFRRDYQHREALRKTIDEGKYVAKDEFQKFSHRAEKKYNSIIKAIKGGAYWEEIKKQIRISDKQLAAMLKRLVNHGFVEKKDRIYHIADPLLEAAYSR
jgi:AAA+ ATPase superfamily predicted ATPase